uniref:Uncharacterized protein n=1 Tax=Setaria digitata TaxID=48799 RepID=A0A915PFJ2_9BILA
MDLLIFERKRRTIGNYRKPTLIPTGEYYGMLAGEQVIVSDPKGADDLNAFGCYGEFLQRREPRVSVECFASNVHQESEDQQEECQIKPSTDDSDPNGDEEDNGVTSKINQQSQRFSPLPFFIEQIFCRY